MNVKVKEIEMVDVKMMVYAIQMLRDLYYPRILLSSRTGLHPLA